VRNVGEKTVQSTMTLTPRTDALVCRRVIE
jgi:hypothetical protein